MEYADSDTEMTAPAEVNTQHDNETAPYDLQTIEKDREEVGNAKQQQRILITQILDLDAEITKLEAEANEIEEENASKKEVATFINGKLGLNLIYIASF